MYDLMDYQKMATEKVKPAGQKRWKKEMEDERDEERNSVHKTENFGRSEKDMSIFLKTQGCLRGYSDRDGADTCDTYRPSPYLQ